MIFRHCFASDVFFAVILTLNRKADEFRTFRENSDDPDISRKVEILGEKIRPRDLILSQLISQRVEYNLWTVDG